MLSIIYNESTDTIAIQGYQPVQEVVTNITERIDAGAGNGITTIEIEKEVLQLSDRAEIVDGKLEWKEGEVNAVSESLEAIAGASDTTYSTISDRLGNQPLSEWAADNYIAFKQAA